MFKFCFYFLSSFIFVIIIRNCIQIKSSIINRKKSREITSKTDNLLMKIKKFCFRLLISRVLLGQIELVLNCKFWCQEKSVITIISCNFFLKKAIENVNLKNTILLTEMSNFGLKLAISRVLLGQIESSCF